MSISYRVGVGGAGTVDLGDVVFLGDAPGFSSRADGSPGSSGIGIQDPGGTLDIVGLNKFVVEESACSNPRIFTGISAERGISRGEYTTGAARLWETDVVDQNGYLQLRIIRDGNHGNRPAETDVQRVAWLLDEVLYAGHVQNGTGGLWGAKGPTAGVIAAPRNLDAADYRGQYATDVLADIGPPGNRRYFTYWDPTLEAVCLFYGLNSEHLADSTLRISNVASDADSVTFAPDQGATMKKDPSAVYGGVLYKYRHGTIYREDPATIATYLDRGVAIENDRVGLATTASTFTDRILDKSGDERISVTCTIRVPKAQVNLVIEGMRIQVRFSHFPGLTSFTYMHVLGRSVAQDVATTDFYNVTLDLCDYVGGFGTGGGGAGSPAVPYVPGTGAQIVSLYEGVAAAGGTFVSDSFDIEDGRPLRLDIRFAVNTGGRVTLDCTSIGGGGPGIPINDGVTTLTHTSDLSQVVGGATGCRVGITPNAGESMTTHVGDAGSVFYMDAPSTIGPPQVGQLTTESLSGTTSGTDYTLNYPYAPGSLTVKVGNPGEAGVVVVPTEVDPTAGTFELGFNATGKTVTVTYQIDSSTTTGSTNPQPSPTTALPTSAAATRAFPFFMGA